MIHFMVLGITKRRFQVQWSLRRSDYAIGHINRVFDHIQRLDYALGGGSFLAGVK